MQEFPQQNQFNPESIIQEATLEMPPQPDADGNLIPSFSEFITEHIPNQGILTEEDLQIMRSVYHTEIYDTPRPKSDPFGEFEQWLGTKILSEEEKERNVDLTGLEKMSETSYFNPSTGEVVDFNNKPSDSFRRKLENYRLFREKFTI